MKKKIIFKEKGQMLISVVIFASVAIYFITSFVGWAVINIRASRQTFNREQAIQIAEAGIDYYRWHLAHAPQDYQDGTGNPGPYIHDFKDKNNNIIGQFTLDITPPNLGSSLVNIRSIGTVAADSNISRTIEVKFAKPSFAQFAVVANDVMRFGEGTVVSGPIHSNKGIRFDGFAGNIVSSTVASYTDPDDSNTEFGVHTHVAPADPHPPNSVPSRPDVFFTGRQFPVSPVDFVGITADLANMRADAIADGFHRAGSGGLGFHVILKTNNTFDLYKVTNLVSTPWGCSNSQAGWGTWSIRTSPTAGQTLLGNYPFPANGIIFLEDHVYIDGQIDNARLTVVAADMSATPTLRNIIINHNLTYTHLDGQDAIGLIAQNNINVGMVSDNILRIDAALIAQNGRVGRHYYDSDCSPYDHRDVLTLWGMIASNQRYGFAWIDGWGIQTGYTTRDLNYDGSLIYGPPPSFPLTTDQYITLSWDEIE